MNTLQMPFHVVSKIFKLVTKSIITVLNIGEFSVLDVSCVQYSTYNTKYKYK